MKNVLKLLNIIFQHPLNTNNKLLALFRILSFNLKKVTNKKQVIFNWVEDAKLIFDNSKINNLSQRQIKFNYYLGLAEYEEMAFLIHALKKDDVFVDCGANLGLYTILASKVIGANSISYEPHPDTVKKLFAQLEINNLKDKVKIISKALGDRIGSVKFSNDKDALRRKVLDNEKKLENFIDVQMTTLDSELENLAQNFILKMDLEGFEFKALEGARNILTKKNLKAIIIENNQTADNNLVHKILSEFNFFRVEYFPKIRQIKLNKNNLDKKLNHIYVKDIDIIQKDCVSSKKYKIYTANKEI